MSEIEALVTLCGSSSVSLRLAVIDRLAELGEAAAPAVPVLAEALRSQDARVVKGAAVALGEIGPGAASVVGDLEAVLCSERPVFFEVRTAAAEALSRIGDSAIPALGRAVESKDEVAVELGAHGLSLIGLAAAGYVPRLVSLVEQREWRISFVAARAIGDIGLAAPGAVEALEALASHPLAELQLAAIRALGQLGSASEPAVPALEGIFESGSPIAQVAAARALCRIREPKDRFVRFLLDSLERYSGADVREIAIEALGEMPAYAQKSVPRLMEILSSRRSNPCELVKVIEILGRLGDEKVVPLLSDSLRQRSAEEQAAAQEALAEIFGRQPQL